jgi:hypothetical protein
MAELDLTNIAGSSVNTPNAGVTANYVDATSKILTSKLSDGSVQSGPALFLSNQSVTTPAAAFAADTYLVGSNISIPAGFPRVGTTYRLSFDVTKTGAGTATAILIVRIGTLGTTSDAAILTFTFTAQTAVIDNGSFEVLATFRTVGSGTSAVLQGKATLRHKLAATGLTSTAAGFEELYVTSAGFNSTPASSIIGASVNGGASAAWTITLVRAELISL